MTKTQQFPWLKILGWAILVHIILIAISFLEVFIYSALINPGQEQTIYDAHAEASGPWISMIFGFILFLFICRSLGIGRPGKEMGIALALTIIYVITDALILTAASVDWTAHYQLFILSFVVKTIGAVIGAVLAKKRNNRN